MFKVDWRIGVVLDKDGSYMSSTLIVPPIYCWEEESPELVCHYFNVKWGILPLSFYLVVGTWLCCNRNRQWGWQVERSLTLMVGCIMRGEALL